MIRILLLLLLSLNCTAQSLPAVLAGVMHVAPSSAYDAATTAYMNAIAIPNDATVYYPGTAQEITGTEIWDAVNEYVLDRKSGNRWTKGKAIYPIIGGSSAAHKYNLKDPQDTDGAFRMEYFGSPSHGPTGIAWNGSSQYANTFLNPSVSLLTTSGRLAYYSRTNSNAGSPYEMGASDDPGVVTNTVTLITRYSTDVAAAAYGNGSYATTVASLDSRGYFVNNRDGGTTYLYKNGVELDNTTESATLPSYTIYVGAMHVGPGGVNFYSNKEAAFISIDEGFTAAEELAEYNAVQALMTALHREM